MNKRLLLLLFASTYVFNLYAAPVPPARNKDGRFLTAGGRVLGVTARGATIAEAVERAYAAADCIRFDGMHLRRDIAARALQP